MQEFLSESADAILVTGNMCQYGMTECGPDGVRRPVAKLTRWLTNSPRLASALSKKCPRDHAHCALQGGARAHRAQIYPDKLCRVIASSFAQELKDLANSDACLISTGVAPGGDSDGGCPDGTDDDTASALDLELSQLELWRDDPSDWPSPLYNDSVPRTLLYLVCVSTN